MTFFIFCLGLMRHAGYALLLSGAIYLAAEAFIPGFVTPYLNPYLLLVSGLVLAIGGAWHTSSTRFGRWLVAVMIVLIALGGLFTQIPFQGARMGVVFASCLLLVAFFLASVYPEEV